MSQPPQDLLRETISGGSEFLGEEREACMPTAGSFVRGAPHSRLIPCTSGLHTCQRGLHQKAGGTV